MFKMNFSDNYVSYKMTEPPESVKIKMLEYVDKLQPIILELLFVTSPISIEEDSIIDKPKKQVNKPKKELLKVSETKTPKGTMLFEEAYNEAVKINPEVSNYKDFLFRIAKRESNFRNILNTAGAKYHGFFLMGEREIKAHTGLTVKLFYDNPVQQILGAVNLYKANLKTIKALGIYDRCKLKGYSNDAMVSGAWLGGAGGVRDFITNKRDPSDSHWYNGKGGTSVGKIMNNWMKNE